MRKISLGLLLISLMFCGIVYSGTISVLPFNDANDVTVEHLEDQRETFQDAINSADGNLIQTDSITTDSLNDNANPEVRWNEAFTDFVFTGLLPPTSVSLSSTTTSGIAYVEGVRVAKDATTKAYTASKQTYVDLSSSGTYTYSEVTINAPDPVVAANSIRLARVSTDSTTVLSVRDDRVLSITLSVSQINDSDSDTVVDVEQTADDNIIRFSVGVGDVKTEQLTIQDGKIEPTTDNDIDLGSSSKKFKDLHVESGILMPSGSCFYMLVGACPTGTTDVTSTYANRFIKTNATQLTEAGPILTGTAVSHTLTVGEMPAHTHSYNRFDGTESLGFIGPGTTLTSDGAVDSTGGDGGHEHQLDSATTLEPKSLTGKLCQVD